jgi:pyruvate dehydrogenase E2 component (dihydrolipoamide acetyltransferase)
MPFVVTMPKLSPTMTQGTIAKWHVKEGEKVEAGDLLLEVATDKAVVEHNALDEGYLRKILVPEGKDAEVNEPIALFTERADESIEGFDVKKTEAPKEPAKKVEIPAVKVQTSEADKRIKASPLAKKLAKDRGIALSTLKGTGPGGRIMKRDLEGGAPISTVFGVVELPLTPMRKVIAQRLVQAKQQIPHFYVSQDIDVEKMVETKKEMDAGALKITFNDFVVRACALALKEHPIVNTGFDADRSVILQYQAIDISVAVTLPEGLITPIVKNADQKGLKEISKEVKELVQKAKGGKLKLEEFQGGSFTVSNLGMFGVADFSGIINPPQSAILAVSGIRDLPVVKEGKVVPGKVMRVTLSCDHRVIDGVNGALFINCVKHYLENPALLLV